MKTAEFNKNFAIDTTAKRGIKAVSKNSPGFPEAMTADGKPFDPNEQYYFFDNSSKEVRQTFGTGLRRIDAAWLGSMGYRIIEISRLRADRNDALADAQEYFRSEIAKMQELIKGFELEKSQDARDLKSFLMAKE